MINNKREILDRGDQEVRKVCIDILEYVLDSIDPCKKIRDNIKFKNESLLIFGNSLDIKNFENIYVLGAGKASYSMAKEVESIIPELIEEGLVVTKYGYKKDSLKKIKVVEAGHPIPDENGQEAGEKILEIARKAGKNDLVINLISGGGSALLSAPVGPVTLSDMQRTTDLLVSSGASIDEINAVRKHLSRVKGGQLSETVHPAMSISLVVSDVVGDRLDVIASGPTVPDSSTYSEAFRALEKYSLIDEVPESVKNYLREGEKGEIDENPGKKEFEEIRQKNIIISNNDKATEAAKEKGEEYGLNTLILSRMIEGESVEAGIFTAGILRDVLRTGTPLSKPALVISGGETTVSLGEEKGEGGPNQEFVLGAASKIRDMKSVAVAAVDTDGTDGPTDIAGGIVDGTTFERLDNVGLSLFEILDSHNSKPALEKIGDSIRTGSTGTNVNDLRIAIAL